ncbi:trypsin-like serine protease, partial [Streptomyces griseoincarnatus]
MRKYWSSRVAAVVTAPMLVAALLISSMAVAPAAEALVGDQVTEGEQLYVVKLEIGAHDRACSGALVEELWVLTAASCFVDDPAQYATLVPGAPALATQAIVGRTDSTSTAGAVRGVVELVPMAGRDLTLARLSSPVTNVEPVSLSSVPAVTSDTVEVSGYGRTADEWAPLRMHRESFTVVGGTATDLQIDSQGGGAICMGDGGGPVVRSGIDGDELVAVASRSWQGGCFGSAETRTAAVATRVDVLAGDIGIRVARWALKSRRSGQYVTAEGGRSGDLARLPRAASANVTSAETYT